MTTFNVYLDTCEGFDLLNKERGARYSREELADLFGIDRKTLHLTTVDNKLRLMTVRLADRIESWWRNTHGVEVTVGQAGGGLQVHTIPEQATYTMAKLDKVREAHGRRTRQLRAVSPELLPPELRRQHELAAKRATHEALTLRRRI